MNAQFLLTCPTLPFVDGWTRPAIFGRAASFCQWTAGDITPEHEIGTAIESHDDRPGVLTTTTTFLVNLLTGDSYVDYGVFVTTYTCMPFGFVQSIFVQHMQPPHEYHEVTLTVTSTPNPPPIIPSVKAPTCSPCGSVVDMVRSCYQGKWRLCKDDSSIVTPGRYYFTKEGTRAYPGFHLLGSQYWYDRNGPLEIRLGEIPDKTKWDNGIAPLEMIPAVSVGDASCIREGEKLTDMVDVLTFRQGVPTLCYVTRPVSRKAITMLESITLACTQKFYAKCISLLYDEDFAGIKEQLDFLFSPDPYTYITHAHLANVPASVTIIQGDSMVVIVDGTSTFWQFAIQAQQSLAAPVNMGPFSTEPFWYDTATLLLDRLLTDGLAAKTKLTLVGHSWGGVASAILLVRLTGSRDPDGLQVLTFGAPKPGDERLTESVRLISHVHLVNDDDPVPIIPFDRNLLNLVTNTFGLSILNTWPNWSPFVGEIILASNGVPRGSRGWFATTDVVLSFVQNALDHTNPDEAFAHTITEYLRRLTLACPD